MRARGIILLVVLAGATGSATPVAGAVEHASDRGQFALAGWSSINEASGVEHFRMIQTSGPLDGPADVAYSGSDSYPVRCADGSQGVKLVESMGQGMGTLDVRRDLSGARLSASFPIETTSTVVCDTGAAGTASHPVQRRLSFDLAGVGPRFTETSGSFVKIPSLQISNQHTRAVVRNATGTFSVGASTHPVVFGDFGRITGVWHYSSQIGDAVARLRTLSANALGSPSATETGSVRRAAAVWERATADSYSGVAVGAERTRDGETLVYMDGYANGAEVCADGSVAARERFRSGEGRGTLDLRGHNAAAQAAGTIDVTTTIVDGCSGAVSTSVGRLAVRLEMTGEGSSVRSGEWLVLHNPPGGPRRVFVSWSGREATGALWVGSQRHATVWGEIGTLRWRQRLAEPSG